MPDLYIMCGAPGVGKSYWLQNHVKPGSAVISRDAIRDSIRDPKDTDFFAKEREIYILFWDAINGALSDGRNVFADQTSLTPRARKYLIDHIQGYDKLYAIWINTPVAEAMKRNASRTGYARVPDSVMRDMHNNFIPPSYEEGFDRIYMINNNKIYLMER